ncbi:MAG TPA: hypothetical protein VM734_00650 [Kofleriaceae bacterium]|jgi:hypothetical protein|nr:hypothetical protein [Kofleriaceae bacterium]
MTPDEARALLRGVSAFTRERGDELWQALLSLEDAAALVREASRLAWESHPRGFDNTDLHARYGDGIVPWLATRLGDDGVLRNQPWCVVPCLLACGSAEAFALAWRATGIDGITAWGGCGDRDLVSAWSARHPEVALAELEHRAATGEVRARAYLRAAGRRATPETADDVLALLDACAARLFATRVRLAPPGASHDVRVVAARAGDDWGLALEWVDGTRPSGLFAARAAGIAYGSRVRGAIDGAAVTSRPLADFHGATLDDRLGPPALALPALGLGDAAAVVAVVPHVAHAPVPSQSAVWQTLAAAVR